MISTAKQYGFGLLHSERRDLVHFYHILKSSVVILLTALLTFAAKPHAVYAGDPPQHPCAENPVSNWRSSADGRWRYYTAGDSYLNNTWYQFICQDTTNWYHFGADGYMTTGWYADEGGHWYYLSSMEDELPGAMKTGWFTNSPDKNWYYLDPDTGRMVLGWITIDGNEYYFNSEGSEQSGWRWDDSINLWIYNDKGHKPLAGI